MGVTLRRRTAGFGDAPPGGVARETSGRARQVRAAASAMLIAALGAATSVTLSSVWAEANVRRPSPIAFGFAVTLATMGPALGGLAAAVDEAAWVWRLAGLGAGLAVLAVGADFHRAGWVALLAAAAVVAIAWWQMGRLSLASTEREDASAPMRTGAGPMAPDRSTLWTAVAAGVPDGSAEDLRATVCGWLVLTGWMALIAARVGAGRGSGGFTVTAMTAGIVAEFVVGAVLTVHATRSVFLRQSEAEGGVVQPWAGRLVHGSLPMLAAAALAAWFLPPSAPLVHGVGRGIAAVLGWIGLHTPMQPPNDPTGPIHRPPTQTGAAGQPSPWPLLLDIAQKLLVAALIVYAAVRLVREYRRLGWHPRKGRMWQSIAMFFVDLWRSVCEWWAGGWKEFHWRLGAVPAGVRRRATARPEARGPRSPGPLAALTPRARVRTAYRALLSAAGRRGHVRHHAATPRRFGSELTAALRDAEGAEANAEIVSLYEAARFSPAPVSPGDARQAAAAARGVIRGLRSQGPGQGSSRGDVRP